MRGQRRVGVALAVLSILAIVTSVACALLAIWGGDGRWGNTALLAFVVGAVTSFVGWVCIYTAEAGR